jgi:inner membrane protein
MLGKMFGVKMDFLFTLGVMLTFALPDIDTPFSFVGRRIPFWRFIFKWFGHRKFFHSLVCWTILTIIFLICNKQHPSFAWGLSFGYLTHILCDTLDRRGVQLLWPYKKTYSVPYIRQLGKLNQWLIPLVTIGLAAWLGWL